MDLQNYHDWIAERQQLLESTYLKRILAENTKKIRKSLVVCKNMYNFAVVFQIYVK